MANRKNTFLLKRSNIAGKIPAAGDLQLGELAINIADNILYASGTTANSILPIGWDRVSRTGDTMTGGFNFFGDVAISGSSLPNGYALSVTGDTNFSGDMYVGGNLYYDGNTIIQSGLTASTIYTDYVDFNTAYTGQTLPAGRLQWDDGNGTLVLGLKGGISNMEIGLENMALCYNDEATTLTAGTVVYVSGSQGNRPSIKRAIATSDGYSVTTLGIVSESILPGTEGFVTTFGMVNNLNTIGYSGGTPIWLSPTISGTFTAVKPKAPEHIVLLGYVVRVHASVGSIFVHISNGWEIDELHDVRLNGRVQGDLLTYSGYNGSNVWVNSKTLNGSYTITGNTNIGGGLTASTISASTVSGNNLYVTGGTQSIFSGNSSSDLVRITQTGTGNAFVVEDSNNTDSTPFVVDANGNVGIGTTSPNAKLDVTGSINNTISGQTLSTSYNSPVNRLDINSNVNLGFQAGASGGIFFYVDGSATNRSLWLHPSSAVLIGNPTATSPNATLHVTNVGTQNSFLVEDDTNPDSTPFVIDANGRVGIGGVSLSEKLNIDGNVSLISSASTKINIESGAGVRTYLAADGAGTSFGSLSNHDVVFYRNNSEFARRTATGFGIGTTTPGANLEVYGVSDSVALIKSAGNSYLKLNRGILAADAHISFDTTTTQNHIIGLINNTDSLIVGGTEASPVITISGSNVGIGNTNPNVALDVTGELAIRGGEGADDARMYFRAADNSNRFTIETDIDVNNSLDKLGFRSTFEDNILVLGGDGNVGIGTNNPTTKLHINNVGTGNTFLVEDSNNPDATPFLIDTDGNVGVGTLAPLAKLHVHEPTILGTTGGSYSLLTTVEGNGSGNAVYNNLYTYRDANGSDWLTTRIHDSIGIDNTYKTPGVDTRTWYERDPYNSIHSWGSSSITYMTIALSVSNTAGNVGIGTTTPSASLHINNADNQNSFLVEDANPDSSPFVIDANGNVGMGTLTPQNVLHVKANPTSTGTATIRVESDSSTANSSISYYSGGVHRWEVGTGISLGAPYEIYDRVGGQTRFSITTSGAAVFPSGNVGIGTTTPTEKLVVNGNAIISGNLTVTGGTQSLFSGNSSVEMVKIIQAGSGDAFVVQDQANGDASHFVINASGNTAIGLTAPIGNDKLTVSGNTTVYGTLSATTYAGLPNSGVLVVPIATSSVAIGTGSNDYYLNFKIPYNLTISKVDFSVSTAGSDSVRIGIYRGQDLTAVLVGQSAGGTVSTLNSVPIVAEVGQNLTFSAGSWVVIGVAVGGTTTNLFGSACPVNNLIAWTNTTDSSGGFPTNPRSKAGTRTSFPSIEITVA
jgi:hypothetical protein